MFNIPLSISWKWSQVDVVTGESSRTQICKLSQLKVVTVAVVTNLTCSRNKSSSSSRGHESFKLIPLPVPKIVQIRILIAWMLLVSFYLAILAPQHLLKLCFNTFSLFRHTQDQIFLPLSMIKWYVKNEQNKFHNLHSLPQLLSEHGFPRVIAIVRFGYFE